MKRIALVFLFASLLSLGISGLRVAVLERLSAPNGPLVAPRPVQDPDPVSDEGTVEYVVDAAAAAVPLAGPAGRVRSAARAGQATQATQAGLLWLGNLRERAGAERQTD